ncbi:hypothetical protein [Streptomyces sp. NBC_00648]|uniref:hypothetical protein n=1 Tax=Streptomyces sp. NBC_00648 TaxID=2975797 RepID=UPI002F909DD4
MPEACAVPEVAGGKPVSRQRVRVPMRLVSAPYYPDIALSVYVKVAALGARPEGCTAKASTIAGYLGVSKASVERGLTALSRPGHDGVVELDSRRRTSRGGTGTSALRAVRPMTRTEAFVWLPVAAAEDLTPRQLRAYALIVHAGQRNIALTEGELAGSLFHHSGTRAGQPLTVTAAGVIVDELEAARWLTVHRRAGAQGRHRFVAHDIAPTEEGGGSPVDEGSGSPSGEGSLATEESPRTDRPDAGRALLPPAVGEIPVDGVSGGVRGRPPRPAPYTGPPLTLSARIHAVLEPVHWLLRRVDSPFVQRQIAREVGRLLRDGTADDRLRHRLSARFAATSPSEIRDPGRWLLGVALPRWGCGHADCEAGVMWSTGRRCEVCAEAVADRHAARTAQVSISVTELEPRRPPPGPPRGSCGDCGCRIFLVGPACADGLCKPCRTERADRAGAVRQSSA